MLLSPAKTMDFASAPPVLPPTAPRHAAATARLVETLRRLPPAKLGATLARFAQEPRAPSLAALGRRG